MRGHTCWHICADDAHGTPVMLRAKSEGVTPEVLIEKMQRAHIRDFGRFYIDFDNYHSTHSEENRQLSEEIYTRLRAQQLITTRTIEQLYDKTENMFLPDRYVRGTCPDCGSPEQFGDSCEKCGGTYSSIALIDPISTVSGTKPILKTSRHFFFTLSKIAPMLTDWVNTQPVTSDETESIKRLQEQAKNKLNEWLKDTDSLRDWDISRDAPYFGFRIPDEAEEKYFYVWLDAPIGYMASFLNLCQQKDIDFATYWHAEHESNSELVHFIGKDILYFHGLFWPAILHYSNYRTPSRLCVHGFLTINGEKMSKSRGTLLTADDYIQRNLDPQWLRYYYACKLNHKIEDIDLSFQDFTNRVNSDLVGKFVNIPSRVAKLLHQHYDGTIGESDEVQLAPIVEKQNEIATLYEGCRYSQAMRIVMALADNVNQYLEAQKPWSIAAELAQADDSGNSDAHAQLHRVCSTGIQAYRLLLILLKPVLPVLAEKSEQFLQCEPLRWDDIASTLPVGHRIAPFKHLMQRINQKAVDAMIQIPTEATTDAEVATQTPAQITIDDFAKLDIRVANVLDVQDVEGADSLLALTLDVGDGRKRHVFSGVRNHIDKAQLVGTQVLYLANLKPRKMRFGVSEGMVLFATDGDGKIIRLSPVETTNAGAKIS